MKFRGVIANYSGQVWAGLVNILVVPLYISMVGLEQYGLIGIYILLQAWLPLLDFGLSQALTREVAKRRIVSSFSEDLPDLCRTAEAAAIFLSISLGILFWLASGLLTSQLRVNTSDLDPELIKHFFQIMGLALGARLYESIHRGVLIGLQKHVHLNCFQILRSTVSGFGAIALMSITSKTAIIFISWQVGVSLISAVVLMFLAYSMTGVSIAAGKPSWSQLSSLWSYSSNLALISFLSLVLTQFDKVILIRLVSLDDFAVYSIAFTLSSSLSLFVAPIAITFFPLFCEQVGLRRYSELRSSFHLSAQLVSLTSSSVGITVIAFAYYIILYWTQNQDIASKGAPILILLTVGMVINSFALIPYHLQLAYGWTRLTVRLNLFLVAIFLPLAMLLTSVIGMLGAALSFVLLNVFSLLIGSRAMFRKILKSEKLRWIWSDILQPSMVCLTLLIVIRVLIIHKVDSAIALFMALGLSSFLAFFASLLVADVVRPAIVKRLDSLM